MASRRHLALAAVLILAAAVALQSAGPTYGLQNGISGRSQLGCTCHGPNPTTGVTPSIQGLPAAFDPGATYGLTVAVTGGPHNGGGFDMLVDGGTLEPDDPNVQAFSPQEVGHNNPDETSWAVKWTAPSGGTAATFYLATNSVNKDGTEAGDQWNKVAFAIPAKGAPVAGGVGGAAGSAEQASVLWLVLAPALAIGAIAALAYRRPAPDAARRLSEMAARAAGRPLLQYLAVFLVALLLSFAEANSGAGFGGQPDAHGGAPATVTATETHPLSGFSNVSQAATSVVGLDASGPFEIAVEVTWTDEPDQPRHTNQPDTLSVTVSLGEASATASGTNAQGGNGDIVARLNLTGAALPADARNVTVVITCQSAGPQKANFGVFGLRDRADSGNAWVASLSANFTLRTQARSAAAGAVAVAAGQPEFAAHAAVESVGVALAVAALASALVLRGLVPAPWLPPRLAPTKKRHAYLGILALAAVGLAAAVGVSTALSKGEPFAPHGLVGLALLALVALQAYAGYRTYRGRPARRLHGITGSALAGALIGVSAAGLSLLLGA